MVAAWSTSEATKRPDRWITTERGDPRERNAVVRDLVPGLNEVSPARSL